MLVLALLQGLTEFLPISSSAHLILVPQIVHWPDQGLAFDVAVHVGTLTAVMVYFRAEIARMSVDWLASLAGRGASAEARLAWAVLFGTIPVGLAGLAFKPLIETHLRSPLVIAATTVLFGLLLWYADARGRGERSEYQLGWKDVLLIGVFQALALVPGTSRSGATITAGLLLGLSREASARYSFLLSIPVIVLSGLLVTRDLVESGAAVDWGALLLAFAVSAGSAYLCIHFFLKLLRHVGMLPFVVYRLLLGGILLILFT